MNTDCFFAIGKTHRVCQDYAKAGFTQGQHTKASLADRPYAVLSDGCSTSPDTDFGARFLVQAAIECLTNFGKLHEDWIIWRTVNSVPRLVSPRCLDATLLALTVDQEQIEGAKPRVHAHVCGDGYVAFKRKDGTLSIHGVDHAGAPGYLSYNLDADRMGRFIKEFGNQCVVTHTVPGQTTHAPITLPRFTAINNLQLGAWFVGFESGLDDTEAALIFSDGVASFTDADFKPVPALDVITRLCDIKSYTGAFVERRLKWFLNKECPKLGWIHSDDVSVAGICTEA